MKYLLTFYLLLTLTLAGRAYAQTSLDDLSGLPSGTGLTVTDTPSAPAPATPAATTTSTPAPAAATSGPGDIFLVAGGIAILAFILLKARTGRARYRI